MGSGGPPGEEGFQIYPLLPQPQGRWTDRVPPLPDPARHAYLAEVAQMMDGRKQRLGQHAAQTAPAWAVAALGPVPAAATPPDGAPDGLETNANAPNTLVRTVFKSAVIAASTSGEQTCRSTLETNSR